MLQKDFADIKSFLLGPAMIYALPLPEKRERTESRSIERAAVALIIEHLFGSNTVMSHTSDGAPYIADCDKHISVSHSADYALLAISDSHCVGVDIEEWRPSLSRIASRFLAPSEFNIYSASNALLLQAWTAKEAIFKTLGIRSLTISEIILPQNPDTTSFSSHGQEITLYKSTLGNSMITLATIETDKNQIL